jgi:glycerophosphoryl diester phosphodiesterase
MKTAWLALLALSAMPASAVEIVAHRGSSDGAPENTLSSVKLAWERDADAVEFDIWLSKDGHAVLFHDKTTKRIGGRDKPVSQQTLEELRQLDVGAWKSEKYRGERIPVLSEALRTVPPGKRFFVEIKCGPEVLPEVRKAFAETGITPDQAAFIAFDYPTIVAAKKMFPKHPAYWLASPKPDKKSGKKAPSRDELIAKAKAGGLDGLDLQDDPVIDADYAKAVKDAGLALHVWTVDDPAEAKRLAAAGVDGITTNRPGFLRQELGLRK